MQFEYAAYGLRIRSDLQLPELAAGPAAPDAPLVHIRLGDAGEIANPRFVDQTTFVADHDFLLAVPDIARYRVRAGTEIVIEPAAGALDSSVRTFLLGTVFGALCHQRGLLPLHASAIEVDGRVVAFGGASGAGKSTLGAYFHDCGYDVVSDDVCVVDVGHAGCVVTPSEPRFKLRPDSAAMLDRNIEHAATVELFGTEKYLFPGRRCTAEALPFDRLYVLSEACSSSDPDIHRLTGVAAMNALLANTYRQFLLSPMSRASAHFAACSTFLKHARVYSVNRRLGWEHFVVQAEAIERHFADGGRASHGEAHDSHYPLPHAAQEEQAL